ncbi:hypothetical protein K504DRAFT_1028 [Pleomassaria siparia CBS 279.74]|uniref:Uncharacterized protein n=1 Tax=Pleomassaria siparia CBS 279.74 TaxID=1314801 RepID=A0A6G1KP66_9PLEO|nr:hypothetical protein K504DRAFT_1028 [Pleomassaria siparia CBS 279.74]
MLVWDSFLQAPRSLWGETRRKRHPATPTCSWATFASLAALIIVGSIIGESVRVMLELASQHILAQKNAWVALTACTT